MVTVPPGSKRISMHPAAILFEEVTASNLHKLDENCNHVEPSDEMPHKFAFPFHKGIYDAFPQAQCVMVDGVLAEYALLAVPFFVFAGDLMSRGGISNRLLRWVASMTHCACGKAS